MLLWRAEQTVSNSGLNYVSGDRYKRGIEASIKRTGRKRCRTLVWYGEVRYGSIYLPT